MSIVIPAGGDFNIILKGRPTRGTCSFPLQQSLDTVVIPGLPPPDVPDDLEVILNLDRPDCIDISLVPGLETPSAFAVEDSLADEAPRLPAAMFLIDLDPAPAAPVELFGRILEDADLPPLAPSGFEVELVDFDPIPAIPLGMFLQSLDEELAMPSKIKIEDTFDGPEPPSCISIIGADELAIPSEFHASDTDPPPATPSSFIGTDQPKVATPTNFKVQLPPEPGC